MRTVTQPDENPEAAEDNPAALLSEQSVTENNTESDEQDPLTLEAILGERDLMDMIDNDPHTLLNAIQKFGQDDVVKSLMASAHLHGNPVLVKQKIQDMIDHARAKTDTAPVQKTNAAFSAVRSFAPVHAPALKIAANSKVDVDGVTTDVAELQIERPIEELTETVPAIETEEFTIDSSPAAEEILNILDEPSDVAMNGLATKEMTPPKEVVSEEAVSIVPASIVPAPVFADILSPADALIVLPVAEKPVVASASVLADIRNIVTPTVTLATTPETTSDNIVNVIATALIKETNTIIAPQNTDPLTAIIFDTPVETPVTVHAGQPSEAILNNLPVQIVPVQTVMEAPVAVPQKIIAETIVPSSAEDGVKTDSPSEESHFHQDIFTPEDALRIMTDVNSFVADQARKQKESAPILSEPAIIPEQIVEKPVMNMARETSDVITGQEISSAEKAKPVASISMHEIKREMTEANTVQKTNVVKTVAAVLDTGTQPDTKEVQKKPVPAKVSDTATNTLADITTTRLENKKPEALEETMRKSVSYSAIDAKASPRFNEFRQSAVMKLTPQTPVLVEEKHYPAPSYGQKEEASYDQPVLSASYIDPVAAFANLYGYPAPQPTNTAHVVPLNTPSYLKNIA